MIPVLRRSSSILVLAIAAVAIVPERVTAQQSPPAPSHQLASEPTSPPSLDQLIQQGITAQTEDRIAEAERLFREVLRRDPNHAIAHRNLGVTLQDQGQLDAAIEHFRQAIALDPNWVVAHYDLGFALRDQGQLDAAIAQFRQAIALNPHEALGYYELGNLLQSQGVVTSQRFDETIGPNPSDPNGSPMVQTHVQMTVAMDGHLEEAITQFRQAIALDPKSHSAYLALGNALQRQGKLEEAIAAYQQAIAINPNLTAAQISLRAAQDALAAGRRHPH